MHIFYPISKSTAESGKYMDDLWLGYGIKTLKALVALAMPVKYETAPTYFMKSLLTLTTRTFKNAPIAEDFKWRSIVPIIYSHGLSATSSTYSQSMRDLASCGFIVFGVNHQDGSCCYTVKKDGTEMIYGNRVELE